jgi:hypothetical protein
MGIRRNNSQLVQSAKHRFKAIFHGRRHPIYSSIEIYDCLIRRLCPKPIKDQLAALESVSKRGDKSKGQGLDFIVEEVNAETKMFIPRGVPDDETWLRVCRNIHYLKAIKLKMMELTGINTRIQGYRRLDLQASVDFWRKRLRETKYLLQENETHTSITGKPLHPNLVSFRILAEGKRANHIAARYCEGAEDTMVVFVTKDEEATMTNVANQTKEQIKDTICQLITQVDCDVDKGMFLARYNRVKGKNKAEVIKLMYEVQNFVNEQQSEIENDID